MRVHVLRGDALHVEIDERGAAIAAIYAPGRDGGAESVVVRAAPYAGATIGRYANRIAHARFALNGREHRLSANEGAHTLHGGAVGFDAVRWQLADATEQRLTLMHESPDGDQGFPGMLAVRVTFCVEHNTLRIEYEARSDADTVANFTNHTYFALDPGRSVSADYDLWIGADAFTTVGTDLIPTGEVASVEGTRYDFRTTRRIGEESYDTNFVLRPVQAANGLRHAAAMSSEASGRRLDVHTTEPGLQVYTGNPGGVALETQHFPDSPNHPHFPSAVLRAGEQFTSSTEYRFSFARKD